LRILSHGAGGAPAAEAQEKMVLMSLMPTPNKGK
jgi:hypothetical protein